MKQKRKYIRRHWKHRHDCHNDDGEGWMVNDKWTSSKMLRVKIGEACKFCGATVHTNSNSSPPLNTNFSKFILFLNEKSIKSEFTGRSVSTNCFLLCNDNSFRHVERPSLESIDEEIKFLDIYPNSKRGIGLSNKFFDFLRKFLLLFLYLVIISIAAS